MMTTNQFHWVKKLVDRLEKSDIPINMQTDFNASIRQLFINHGDWGRVAQHCAVKGCRFVALWAEENVSHFLVNACYEKSGDYLLVRASVALSEPVLSSIAEYFCAACRLERHCHDLLGIQFTNSPDNRRWLRHQSWSDDSFPLRHSFALPAQQGLAEQHGADQQQSSATPASFTPGDNQYPFHVVEGDAVYEIPVGPVHAGIIEPGHFRFHAVGETVLHLEERLGYVHKGIEKIAVGRDINALLRLAGRVSGDSTVAHAWAACQAAEQAAAIEVPERALVIRAILAERERVANHLGDIGAICNDVSFIFAHMQFSRLREAWQRRSHEVFGHRLMMDTVVAGGVNCDISHQQHDLLAEDLVTLRQEVYELLKILRHTPSLRARLENTGVLQKVDAERLGCLGFVGRASGLTYDVRIDCPYPPYQNINFDRITQQEGDVAARVIQRGKELLASLSAQAQLLEKLVEEHIKSGSIKTTWLTPPAHAEGIGIIEGWRGEIISYLRFDDNGHISRYYPRDPSWFNWPALECLIHGNIVPDFPVCNKSINGSYAGHDL